VRTEQVTDLNILNTPSFNTYLLAKAFGEVQSPVTESPDQLNSDPISEAERQRQYITFLAYRLASSWFSLQRTKWLRAAYFWTLHSVFLVSSRTKPDPTQDAE
jgi:hypothetical protein